MLKNNYTIQEVKENIDIFSEFNYIKSAYEYYKGLKEFLDNSNLKQSDPEFYNEYYRYLIRFRFLTLEFLDDWRAVEELIKENYKETYYIKNFDLWHKIKVKLLSIPSLEKRDEVKTSLKKVFVDNNIKIIKKDKYDKEIPITTNLWIKNFIANLGIKQIDKLKKIQYLTNSEKIKKLDENDKKKVKIFFNLYEKLSLSSNTPEGLEDDIPMTINGKNIIYSKGQADEIKPELFNIIKSIRMPGEEPIIKTERKEIEDINKLKEIVEQYPPGSLERKAIEEEIEKAAATRKR